jgi:hypothetical protein
MIIKYVLLHTVFAIRSKGLLQGLVYGILLVGRLAEREHEIYSSLSRVIAVGEASIPQDDNTEMLVNAGTTEDRETVESDQVILFLSYLDNSDLRVPIDLAP